MDKKNIKVIFDANIILSFFLTSGPTITTLFSVWKSGFFRVFISPQITSEIKQVSGYPKLQKYLSSETKRRLFVLLDRHMRKTYPKTKVNFRRDPGDAIYLEAAQSCGADYIVTGDSDLLDLKIFGKTKILTPKEFLEKVNSGE